MVRAILSGLSENCGSFTLSGTLVLLDSLPEHGTFSWNGSFEEDDTLKGTDSLRPFVTLLVLLDHSSRFATSQRFSPCVRLAMQLWYSHDARLALGKRFSRGFLLTHLTRCHTCFWIHSHPSEHLKTAGFTRTLQDVHHSWFHHSSSHGADDPSRFATHTRNTLHYRLTLHSTVRSTF